MKAVDPQIQPAPAAPAERRDASASALRDLFREQWGQLRARIRHHEALRRQEQERLRTLDLAVEQVVDGTDRRLRAVGRYRKRLRRSTRCLLNYIGECVAQLPPARPTDRASFYRDDLLRTLFGGYDTLQRLLAEDPLPREAHQQGAARYAVTACNRRQRTVEGAELRGEMLVRGVAQQRVDFINHRLLAVAATESDLRNALKRILFERVVAHLRDTMTRLHHGLLEERERRELPGGGEGIEAPGRYLEVLEWLLSLPLELVRIDSERLCLDGLGVLQPEPAGTPVRIEALTLGDRPPQVLCLLRIDTDPSA